MSADFAEKMAEDRRLIMLRALREMSGMTLNETMLKIAVKNFGHPVGRDLVRGDMAWLEEQRLVRLEKMAVQDGEFWVAHMTEDGEDVALGRTWPGVARRPA
jgi:hypothetical protein